eukprot:189861-Hanusia_phi.AAC.1
MLTLQLQQPSGNKSPLLSSTYTGISKLEGKSESGNERNPHQLFSSSTSFHAVTSCSSHVSWEICEQVTDLLALDGTVSTAIVLVESKLLTIQRRNRASGDLSAYMGV